SRFDLSPDVAAFEGTLIVIDTSTLSPIQNPVRIATPSGSSRVAVVTTYQGSRYHPETIRALAEDPAAVAAFASRVASGAARSGNGMFVDFQGDTPDDLKGSAAMWRAIA